MLSYDLIFEQWKNNRYKITHPLSLHKPEDLRSAAKRFNRSDSKISEICELIEEKFGHIPEKGEEYLINMITDTTPGPCLFNLSPEHDMGVPHGMWKWDPMDPDHLTDEVTGTKFPNEKYAEDLKLKTFWGKEQEFTFYSGKSILYNGFHIYPSFSGFIRGKKSVYMIEAAYKLALYYHITGKREYILKAKDILLRFADVYPFWLAHGMYGDIADMDPKQAGASPKNLPGPRTSLSPNENINEIHVGYWGLGRASLSGMEGVEVLLPVSVAYDLVAAVDGLLSDSEKEHIEKDLLLECATLVMNDPALNNKSSGNNIGVLAAGMVTGVEAFVDIGRKCFNGIVLDWYLKDGSTSESPAYSMMVMRTLWVLSEMLMDYKGVSGSEEKMPVYDWNRYKAVWKGMYDTLLQNYRYPASADSYAHSRLNTTYCEILAYRFKRPEYIALLNESLCIEEKEANPGVVFLPGETIDAVPEPVFRNIFYPDFRQAYMRIGNDGSKGTLLLNGSDWGIHHHNDSLNLFYYHNGNEWLTDLGYLWDQPHKFMTVRTAAHQLVVVNGKEQVTRGRKSTLNAFLISPGVKLTDMSSDVYPEIKEYRRASAVIEHREGHYILDIFLVNGESVKDYLLHGPDFNYDLIDMKESKCDDDLPYDMEEGVVLKSCSDASGVLWRNGKNVFKVFLPQEDNEKVILAKGFGQRGKTDLGAKIPYLMRRTSRNQYAFVTVMGSSIESSFVESVKYTTIENESGVVVKVNCQGGYEDTILYSYKADGFSSNCDLGEFSFNGIMAVYSTVGGTRDRVLLYGGNSLEINGMNYIGKNRNHIGKIVGCDDCGFLTDVLHDELKDVKGLFALVLNEGRYTGYEVFDVLNIDGHAKLIVNNDEDEGYMPLGGESFIIYSSEVL